MRIRVKKRVKNLLVWHRWFAWHPVVIGDHLVWLEPVERICKKDMWGKACVLRYRHIDTVTQES
jgi:hypothetical protein